MAVVYRFPDRSRAEQGEMKATDGVLPSAEILILPCIRRERIELRQNADPVRPAQLQA